MLDVMGIDETRVATTGESATLVPGSKSTIDRGWDRSGFSSDIEWLAILILSKYYDVSIAAESLDAFDGKAGSTITIRQCRLIDVDGNEVVIRCVALPLTSREIRTRH